MFNKIRIAPTPSGYLHLGNVLSFALTAALAQRVNARILLRIDDMDRQRANSVYLQDIFDTLNYLELPWHEGPRNLAEFESGWSQLHRMHLYREALQQLQDEGHVFACTCSRKQIRSAIADESYTGTCRHKVLPFEVSNSNWRLHTPAEPLVQVKLWPQGTQPVTLPATQQYFVVRKKDGYPAYQLSSLVDDVHFGITHIVRGADLWESTLAQLHLADVLQFKAFQQVQFYHHSLLMDNNQQKLSKSAGSTSIRYLREQGHTPAQVYRLIADQLGLNEAVGNWQQLADAFWAIYA